MRPEFAEEDLLEFKNCGREAEFDIAQTHSGKLERYSSNQEVIPIPCCCLSGTRLKQAKALKFLANDCVALTGGVFQFSSVFDGHVAPRIVNETSLVQHSCRQRYRTPRSAQHLCQKLVGEGHSV